MINCNHCKKQAQISVFCKHCKVADFVAGIETVNHVVEHANRHALLITEIYQELLTLTPEDTESQTKVLGILTKIVERATK